MNTHPYIATAELKTSLTCWKCGSRLVVRGRGLYCNRCHRFRKFLVKTVVQWQRRGGGQEVWSRVDVKESGRQRRKVMLRERVK